MQAFQRLGDIEPRWLIGRRPEATQAFAERWRFAHHSTRFENALNDDQVDSVVITTPHALHAGQAMGALQAGKHVLVEIPLALSLADARRVIDTADQNDRRLMVCHTMRTFPAIVEMKRRIEAGMFTLHHLVGYFGIVRRNNMSWDGRERSWTDDILWHHAAHIVDIALWLAQPRKVAEVTCRFGPAHPTQGFLDLSLILRFEDNTLSTIVVTYNTTRSHWGATFIGEEGTLGFRDGGLTDFGDQSTVMAPHSVTDLFDQNCEFVRAVQEKREPAISGRSILPAMIVLDAAERSARTMSSVTLS
jgi:2-hydroxy-4-carboxymuconate semialdehyde hemiacetal dehydrogenase